MGILKLQAIFCDKQNLKRNSIDKGKQQLHSERENVNAEIC